MATINLVQGDTGPQIKVTVTREDTGLAVDLTGSSAVLKVRPVGAADVAFTLANVNTSDSLEDGFAIFSFAGGVLAEAQGDYEGEVEITFADGTIETIYDKIEFFIREDF